MTSNDAYADSGVDYTVLDEGKRRGLIRGVGDCAKCRWARSGR